MERWFLFGVLGEFVFLVLEFMGLLLEVIGRAVGLLGLEAVLGEGFFIRLFDLKAVRCLSFSLFGGVGVVVRFGGLGVRGSFRVVKERVYILGSSFEVFRFGVFVFFICFWGGFVYDSGSRRFLGSVGVLYGEFSVSGSFRCIRRFRKFLSRGTGFFLVMGVSGIVGLLGFWVREVFGARVVEFFGVSVFSGFFLFGFICDREDLN